MATLSEIERDWGYDDIPDDDEQRDRDIDIDDIPDYYLEISYADCLWNKRHSPHAGWYDDEYPYMYIHTCRIYTTPRRCRIYTYCDDCGLLDYATGTAGYTSLCMCLPF